MNPYLPTPNRLGNRQSEAGNRAQSDICCEVTLALTGSSHGETEPRKATYLGAGRNTKPPTSLEKNFQTEETFPPHLSMIAARI